ncbi:hypothetical protein EDB89DRAFT_2110991 [Lactarius sanguifluus]|nr:hypothetical protein EDB89DRAFT_2110991 [Lactarius sanguifluus]
MTIKETSFTKVIHGFYRYTDIWNKVLKYKEDGYALKAIIAHDALVHPDHPLRLEGKQGIELSIGTLENGEARLLFSSAAVRKPQMIDKNNRKLKGSDSNLNARRLMFERIRSLWSEQRGAWCAVDFEAWDLDHRVITEFGWSMFYHYGQSEDVTLKQLRERIHNMIQSTRKPGPLFLVFHDNHEDLKYLRSPEIEAPLEDLSFFLPESCAEAEASDTNKIYVIDTSELFAALEGDSGGQKRSLERVCRLLQIKSEFTQHLHNAGNDARCTHLVLKEMASGDPLDMQRTARWPLHTSTNGGLRVRFSKEDEDSDAMPS